jgi:hypothetical protein
VGSSHNRLTSAEDNEEALLLALPGHRSFGPKDSRTNEKEKTRGALYSGARHRSEEW